MLYISITFYLKKSLQPILSHLVAVHTTTKYMYKIY